MFLKKLNMEYKGCFWTMLSSKKFSYDGFVQQMNSDIYQKSLFVKLVRFLQVSLTILIFRGCQYQYFW